MEAAALIARYGYAAVFAGTLLEGETVLLLAGYAAHRGYLDWATVVVVAWFGATLGDQLWFALGRYRGARLRAAWPALDVRMTRALVWVGDHPDLSILAMRFLWGLRAALPVALGMSRVSWTRFLGLNLASAAVWAMLVAGLGWSFGAFLARHAPAVHRYEHGLFVAVVILALLAHGVRRWRERTRSDTLRP
jgi:membrane protein DedA with SNARE-associated domain